MRTEYHHQCLTCQFPFISESTPSVCPDCLSQEVILLKSVMTTDNYQASVPVRGVKGTDSQWISKTRQAANLKPNEGFIVGGDGIGRVVEK